MTNKYFDKQKQQKALEWLDKKWPQQKRICELCGNNHWEIAPELVSPLPYNPPNISIGIAYPQLMIVCNNCGNVKYVNAGMVGIVEEAKEEKND